MAQEKLKVYYARTDDKPVYAIATVMDPRAKYQWWVDEEWEEEYVTQGKTAVKNEWQSKYKPIIDDDVMPTPGFCLFRPRARQDQLEEYVAEAPADETVNVLHYWRSRDPQWPELARMARRYMAIPASSAPSERCFSAARYTVPFQRNRLHPLMFKKSVLLQSWIKLLDR